VIPLTSPARGRQPAQSYTLEIAPDLARGAVALTLQRTGKRERLHLITGTDDALDLAMRLVGAVIRIRDRSAP